MPDLIALGEPMVEFAAEDRGGLGQAAVFRRGWGGDTSNVAVAAVRLGTSAGYVTRLGPDEFGRSFLDLWEQEGVDASHVVVDPEGFTGIYFIALDAEGRHDFTYYRAASAASRLHPGDIDPNYLATARIFHTSGITQAISDSAQATAEAAMLAARRLGVAVSYDLNIRPKLRPLPQLNPVIMAAVEHADVVLLSAEDAGHLFGSLPQDAVVEELLGKGPRLVVLKQGADGCLIGSADGVRVRQAGWPARPVDTTGAGDAFDAAFLVEWMRGMPLDECGRFANAVGALAAGGLGAVAPLPTRARVEAFMAESVDSVAKGGSTA